MKRTFFSLLAVLFLFCVYGEKCWERNYNFVSNTFIKTPGNKYLYVGAEYSNSAIKWNYFQTDSDGKIEWDSTAFTPSFTANPSIVATPDSGYLIAGIDNGIKFWKYNKQHKLLKTKIINYTSNSDKVLYSLLPTKDNNILALIGSELRIIKLKPNGDSIWMKHYTDYFAGSELVSFDPKSSNYYCMAIKNGVNVLVKFDENGKIVWDKTINNYAELNCQPTSLTVTKNGDFLITFGTYMVFYMADQNGDVVWRKSYSDIGANAYCSAVTATHNGGFMTANDVNSRYGFPTIYLMKLDSKGDTIYTIKNSTATLFPQKIIEDPADSSFVLLASNLYVDDTRVYKFDSACHQISSVDLQKYFERNLSCYPNPFRKEVNILLKAFQTKTADVYFYNFNGELVLTKQIIIGTDNINTNNLPKGIYLLKLVVDQKVFYSKLVKLND